MSLALLAGAVGGWAFYWLVVLHPGEEIDLANIQRILGKESPVFYSDGTTRLGAFFDQAHRQYVTYDQIPKILSMLWLPQKTPVFSPLWL